jgi:hypothetical protein
MGWVAPKEEMNRSPWPKMRRKNGLSPVNSPFRLWNFVSMPSSGVEAR